MHRTVPICLVALGCYPDRPQPMPERDPSDIEAPLPVPPPPPVPKTPPPPPEPTFSGTHGPIPADVRAKMTGVTWKEGCPVHIDDLALVEVSHWDMDGVVQTGQLVVAASQAEAIVGVMETLFEARFPIHKMRLAHEYGGSDDASMADNNTSAFNCRAKTGGKSWSEHSYGAAIDINTIQNPYVRGTKVLPPEGKPYVERSSEVPGLIVAEGPVVPAFRAIGWKWGGNWRSLKDYQHFSASGK